MRVITVLISWFLREVGEQMDTKLSMVPGTYVLPLPNHLLELLYIPMADL